MRSDHLLSLRLAVTVLAVGLALGSCLGPTEIRLHVHTNLPCTDPAQPWQGVSVHAGTPGRTLETKAPVLTTTACDAKGEVGSLVVVPSGSDDQELGLLVIAGVSRKPEECAANHYQGCIVARRTVHFNRHTPVDLDVELSSDCVGLGCDFQHTCVAGACNDVRTPEVPAESGDAGSSPAVVQCGNNGVFCPTSGNVCCLTVDRDAQTSSGECKKSTECGDGGIVLFCDDTSECEGRQDDAGNPFVCLLATTADPGHLFTPRAASESECVSPLNGLALELCQTRRPCRGGKNACIESQGTPNSVLPGYYWCELGF